MIFHPRDALVGFGLYLAVCLVALVAGNGLLKLMRVRLEDQLRFYFAPILTLVFWVLGLGLVGAVGWPLKYVCPCVWGATLVLFGYGCWGRPRVPPAVLPGLLLCALLPVLGMARAFAFGLTEYPWTLGGDGWNYLAVAQYNWEFGRNVLEGQPAFYDSGIHMMPTRYIAPSLLALLSCLRAPGETLGMGSLLQAFALSITASAVFFLWLAQQRSVAFTAAATTVTLLCGWVLGTIWWSNHDNTVFLFFMPALAGVLAVMPPGDRAFRVLCGLLLAAGGYIYVECFPIGLAGALVLAAPRLWRERAQGRAWLAAGAVAVVVAALLLLPAARMLTGFFLQQLHVANTYISGGEAPFPGFLDPRRFLESLWCLSGGAATKATDKHRWICTAGLTVLFALGLCQLLRERRWDLLLCLGLFGAGVAYLVLRSRHDYAVCNYGIFKLLNLSWCCLAATLVSGAELLVRLGRCELFLASFRNSRVFPSLLVTALLPLGASYAYLSRVSYPSHLSLYVRRLSDLRQTEALQRIAGNEPVLDASDDWLNCLASRYHLRGLNVTPLLYRGTLVGLAATRAPRPCSPATRFLLTDTFTVLNLYLEQVARRVQVLGTYTLWELHHDRPGRGATIVAIDNPYGLENHNNVVHLWLGPGKGVVHVLAANDGELLLDCSFVAGPCGPDRPLRTMKLSTTAGFTEQQVLGIERKPLRVPVRAGLNQVSLEALDQPVRAHASAGDPRTLLLFVILHSTRFESTAESASPCGSRIECPRRPDAP